MTVAVAGVTLLALATLGAPRVAEDQAERTKAVTPQVSADQTADDSGQLRMIDPFAPQGRRWNGHAVSRYYYARGHSSVTAPGISRMPAPGEYVASPALAALIERDDTIAGLFDGLDPAGVIGSTGLTQPHELTAVVGISAGNQSPLLVEVGGFGGPPSGLAEDHSSLNRLVIFFVLALVWLPVGGVIMVVSRLSSRQRSRRARSLHLLGLSRRSVLWLVACEGAVIGAPGALAGAIGYDLLIGRVTSVPGTEIGFFAEPARAGWLTSTCVCLLVVGAFAASAAAGVRRDAGEWVGVTLPVSPAKPRRRRWGTRFLWAGLGLLILAPFLHKLDGGVGFSSLWVGCAVVALGLGMSGPVLATRAMKRVAGRARSVSALVGLRLGSVETGSIRLAGLFSVVIVLLLGGLAFINVLNGGSTLRWNERLAAQPHVPVVVTDLVGDLSLRQVRDIAPDSGAVETLEIRKGQQQVPIVFGNCVDLERLTGAEFVNCSNKPQWIHLEDSPTPPQVTGRVGIPGGGVVEVPDPSVPGIQMQGPGSLPEAFSEALLVPANLAPTGATGDSSQYFLLARNVDLKLVMARLTSGSPQLQFDLGHLDFHNPDTRPFPEQVRWLTVGAIVGLLLGLVAIAAAAIGEASERSSRMRGLRILGAQPRVVLAVHLWSSVVPILLLGWLAVVVSWLVCFSMRTVDDRAALQVSVFAWTALYVSIAGLMVGLLTYPAVTKRSAHSAAVVA